MSRLCQQGRPCGASRADHCPVSGKCEDDECYLRHHEFVEFPTEVELLRLEGILLRYQRAPVDSTEEQEASDALLAEMERLEKENP